MPYLEIGSAPSDESCVQVGSPDYETKARLECGLFIQALRAKLGPEPEGARLAIKSFPHDFGRYLEVVCYYEEPFPASVDYAFKCESDGPTKWTSDLIRQLPAPAWPFDS